jgi:Rrf2 family protein
MFTQTSEYTLRVVVFLASIGNNVATTRQIAAATHVPEGYLSKILQILSRAGIVSSQRGLHGGSVLARDPTTLSVYEVMQVVSPLQRIHTCPLGLASHGTNLCPVHRRLDDAMALVETALRASMVAELVTSSPVDIPLVQIGTDPAAAARATEKIFPVKVSARRAKPKPDPSHSHRPAK